MAFPRVKSVWEEQVQRQCFPAWAIPLGNRIPETGRLLDQDDRSVLSICDLNPANILWVWLLAGSGPALPIPFVDLATICIFLTLPHELALGLLKRQEQTAISGSQKLLFGANSRSMQGRFMAQCFSALSTTCVLWSW